MKMTMDKYDIEKLRNLPIEGVAQRLGLRVERHKSLCPFHEDSHPSLSFKVSKNTCRCFVCMTQSIGPIDLVMRHLGKDFKEACRWLADEHNIILDEWKPAQTDEVQKPFDATRFERFFDRPWLNEEARRFLLEERRLDARVVRWCRLTSWRDRQGVPWLQIPYYDREGRLVGVQNRNLVKGGYPRFRFPQGSRCSIYNLPVLNRLKAGDALYITEGCSDCWAMLSAGHKAIAIPSATLLTQKDVELLKHLEDSLSEHFGDSPRAIRRGLSFHMFPDRDEPGERLFLQLKQVLPTLQHHQLPPGCKDYSEMYLSVSEVRGTRCEVRDYLRANPESPP